MILPTPQTYHGPLYRSARFPRSGTQTSARVRSPFPAGRSYGAPRMSTDCKNIVNNSAQFTSKPSENSKLRQNSRLH